MMASRRSVPRPTKRAQASEPRNVVDSSGWLEYVDGGLNADIFEPAILATDRLMVPTISILEVFKRMLREKGEEAALDVVAQMRQGEIVDLDADMALEAGRLGIELKLPLADSVILAAARRHRAILWTQDEHFNGINGVHYIAKLQAETD